MFNNKMIVIIIKTLIHYKIAMIMKIILMIKLMKKNNL